jgi:hypothetical protein
MRRIIEPHRDLLQKSEESFWFVLGQLVKNVEHIESQITELGDMREEIESLKKTMFRWSVIFAIGLSLVTFVLLGVIGVFRRRPDLWLKLVESVR